MVSFTRERSVNNPSRAFLAAVAAVSFAACAPARAPATAPLPEMGAIDARAGSARALALSNDTHWARNSAEHHAVYLEVYRAAGERLATLMTGHAAGTWAVILDADETVLDNSDYQKSRVPAGGTFDAISWNAWVSQGHATALPGAVAFVALVHQLGGKVVIVTNRDAGQCPITRTNLEQVAIINDLVLCRTSTSNKNPRFEAVRNGTASPGLPALVVLEWIGDNIQDFPALDQSIRSGTDASFARFGDTYFVLPNAMYGSWETNPRQ